MVILDDDRCYVHANSAACELLGVGRRWLLGRRVDEFAAPATREKLAQTWASLLRAGSEAGRYELVRADGSRVDVEFTITARVARGRYLGVLRDLAERNRADTRFERQRRRLIEAQAVAKIGSWECDLVTDVNEWSDEMYRIYGVDGTTIPGLATVIRCLHPDDRAGMAEVIELARSTGVPFCHEYRVVHPDGTIRMIESRGEVITDEHGTARRIHGTAQDITARRQLDAEREHLSTVLDASEDAITACSRDGGFSIWNRGAELLFGYTAAEAIGQPLTLVVPPEGHETALLKYEQILRGERVAPLESVRVTKDGRTLVIATTLSPITDATGAITGVAAVGRDVTRQHETLAALADAHSKAVEASRLKSQFMANMNHELRTPLNGVIGVRHLLMETPLTEEQREYAEALRVSGDALLAVIDDILDFSKIEAGKLDLEQEPFELRTLVEDVALMVAVGQPARSPEVIAEIDPGLANTFLGDANRVRQVLTNLANNAVKFTEAGQVVIRVTQADGAQDEDLLRFEVADTGIGIDPDAQDSIFDSFAQADGSTTRRYGGTGLGLTIAKQLVTMMGGQIGVDSTPGAGSTFWFALPLSADDAGRPRSADPALRDVRVLIVDDKETNRKLLSQRLAIWGMNVDSAADGGAALAALKTEAAGSRPYGLVLLDFRMPGIGGGELAAAIDADPAIASTAMVLMVAARDKRVAAAIPRLRGVVAKPIRETQLHDALARAVSLQADPALASEADPPGETPAAKSARRVLVAEDNPVNQLVAIRLLQVRGFNVDVAANGYEALQMHERHAYDAIFMDCHMPELDGYDATREIRRREGDDRHTPIIAMTASTMLGDEERCLAAGMDYYSGKPIKAAGLDYILARAFDHSDLSAASR